MHAAAQAPEPEPELGAHPHDIPRLGETAEFGSLLLRLLELGGWSVHQLPAFAGDGIIVIAHRRGRVVEMRGETIADVAVPIYEEAMRKRDKHD